MDDPTTSPKRAPGRPPGDGSTRDAILDAARVLFGTHGYDGASMRAIAKQAGVDPGLIRHFFTDKEGLFAATVADRTAIAERLLAALAGDPDRVGARLADAYLGIWEDPDTGPILRAIVRTALTSERSAGLLREMLAGKIIGAIGGDDELPLRMTLAGSHMLGVAAARYLVGIDPLAAIERAELVAILGPVLQQYLHGPLPRA